ncbi:MAG: hypothetical protein N4A45_10310 [Flavobacteriales bacterium]|jgi:hypothetical protein|nr:hypothetical protein [Flavobacteriales bacterium]
MSCVSQLLTADLLESANVLANKEGLGGCKLVLINRQHILGFASDGSNKMVITDIDQRVGTSGFALSNIKQLNDTGTEFVSSDDDEDGHKHTLNFVIRKPTREVLLQLSNMKRNYDGFVAIVKHKFQGEGGQDQLRIYGLEAGMKVTAYTSNSKEYTKVTLSTKDNNLETESYRIYDEGVVADNLAKFENNFPA